MLKVLPKNKSRIFEYIQKTDTLKFPWYIGLRKQRQSLLSIHHSPLHSISSKFFVAVTYCFFFSDFFHETTLFQHLRTHSLRFAEILFFLAFEPKTAPKIGHFVCLFFWKFYHSIFLKKENYCDINFPSKFPCQKKLEVLSYCQEWADCNQIVGFLKVQHLKNKLKHEIYFWL